MQNSGFTPRRSLPRRRFLQLTTLVAAGAGITGALAQNAPPADLDRFLTEITPIDRQSLEFSEYAVEAVTIDRTGKITTRTRHIALSTRQSLAPSLDLEMVYIPGGSFQQGSPPEEKGDFTGSEKPTRPVTTEAFLLGKYPITQAQWQAIATLPRIDIDLPSTPAHFLSETLPVESVTWFEAIEFCKRLSRATGRDYRLPSESRWEYACRAGTTTPFHSGETITGTLANYFAALEPYAEEPQGNYRTLTTPVGEYLPNAFGLYDMHGNVGEWCADLWHRNYNRNPPADGTAWLAPDPRIHPRHRSARLVRGGSWGDEARHLRSANRTFCASTKRYSVLGFRVMASLRE